MRINGDDFVTGVVLGVALLAIPVVFKQVRTFFKKLWLGTTRWFRAQRARRAAGRNGYIVLNAMHTNISFVQTSYGQMLETLQGRLSEDAILTAVTRLEQQNLVKHRLATPPDPRALFAPAGDASLLFPSDNNRKRKMPSKVAANRRKQVAEDREWLHEYDCYKGGFIPEEKSVEQRKRYERLLRNLEDLRAAGLTEES